MARITQLFLSALTLMGIAAVAQEPETKNEAQKVKDSIKMDVRNLGKISVITTTTTTTTRKGRRKKKRDEQEMVKPVADSLIVKDTVVRANDSIRQNDMPVIEVEKTKTE